MAMNLKKRKYLATALTATMVAAAAAPVAGFAAEAQKSFPDVEPGTDYTEPIAKLKEAGVITGMPDGTFQIRGKVTRAQAAMMFTSIRDLNTKVAAAPFTDVKQGVWYSDAINAAYAAGVISGMNATTFDPNGNLTRGQFARMAVDAYGLELKTDVELPFTDVKEDAWYTPYIKTLYANGLIKGKTGTTFAPGENVDRGDFAILLTKADINHGHKLKDEIVDPGPEPEPGPGPTPGPGPGTTPEPEPEPEDPGNSEGPEDPGEKEEPGDPVDPEDPDDQEEPEEPVDPDPNPNPNPDPGVEYDLIIEGYENLGEITIEVDDEYEKYLPTKVDVYYTDFDLDPETFPIIGWDIPSNFPSTSGKYTLDAILDFTDRGDIKPPTERPKFTVEVKEPKSGDGGTGGEPGEVEATLEITDVENLGGIKIQPGGEYVSKLVPEVTVYFSDSIIRDAVVPVDWQIDETIVNKLGYHEVVGILDLSGHPKIKTTTLTAVFRVEVVELTDNGVDKPVVVKPTYEILNVVSQSQKDIEIGGELRLPPDVEVVFTDAKKDFEKVPVKEWIAPENFDPTTPGFYTFIGTLDLSETGILELEKVSITNPNEATASIIVYVKPNVPELTKDNPIVFHDEGKELVISFTEVLPVDVPITINSTINASVAKRADNSEEVVIKINELRTEAVTFQFAVKILDETFTYVVEFASATNEWTVNLKPKKTEVK